MRVLLVCDGTGVSEYYRTLAPYMMLQDAGFIKCIVDGGENPALIDHLSQFGAVVFSRPDSAVHSLILHHALRQGVRVVLDIDDNLLMVPPSIGAYGAWRQRGTGRITDRLWYLKKNIRLADVLTHPR